MPCALLFSMDMFILVHARIGHLGLLKLAVDSLKSAFWLVVS